MKAVAYKNTLPIDNPSALQDVELPDPIATGRDLLVEVKGNNQRTLMRRGYPAGD